MKIQDFNYFLPEESIAHFPSNPRDAARLLHYKRKDKSIEHKIFRDLENLLKKGDVLVVNASKVIPARLYGEKESGREIEILLVREENNGQWECMVKRGGKRLLGEYLYFPDGLEARVEKNIGYTYILTFNKVGKAFWDCIEKNGEVPLPPYIKRENEKNDTQEYQTIYSKDDFKGSVAAPTAGLHFTQDLLEKLKAKGVEIIEVILHVGLGTFLPIKVEEIEQHVMHKEFGILTQENAKQLNDAKQAGRRIIAVGTTSVRVLETFSDEDGVFSAQSNWIDIFITPGYRFHAIDALITNFHLPQSTLLVLVSAFMGREEAIKAYELARDEKYRFFSYGDAMFIE